MIDIHSKIIIKIPHKYMKYAQFNDDGGPGSGNFGHEGRPGKVGGSSGGGSDNHKGNQSNSDVINNIEHGMNTKNKKVIQGTLSDIRLGDTINISAKTHRGNEYKLSVQANQGDLYKVSWIKKGLADSPKNMSCEDAAEEVAFFNSYTQGARATVGIERKNPK